MAKPFKDRTEVKEKVDGLFEWSFKAPSYDNRTSSSIPAGNYYGSAIPQNVGKFKASGPASGPIPQTSKCFSPKDIFEYEDKKG